MNGETMKTILPIVIICSFLTLIMCSDTSDEPVKEVTIGALIPISGAFGQQGVSIRTALELAIEDANSDFVSRNINITLNLQVEDTGTEPAMAVSQLESMLEAGVRIIIGPVTSAELLACKESINSSEAVIISPSSTSIELSISGDNIYRMVPDDRKMAEAISAAAWYNGLRHLLLLHHDGLWANGLAAMVQDRFEALGGQVLETASYTGYRNSLYEEAFDTLRTALTAMLENYDASSIGVQISTYDEAIDILSLANGDSLLSLVDWFGSDGIATNSFLLTDSGAVDFARTSHFAAPIFGLETNEKLTALTQRLNSLLENPSGNYGYLAYDGLRIAADVYATAETDISVDGLKALLMTTMEGYEGVSGTATFNENGDRANGVYHFWSVNSDYPSWELIYTSTDGSIEGG
jgi:branched-chain amino acid transport system substrate-binding protein